MNADPRDAILNAVCPMVMAPTLGDLEQLQTPGKRLIAARDGVYLEARSDALHWLLQLQALPMPYGEVMPFLRLLGGDLPRHMLFELADRSLAASPQEVAFGVQLADDGYELLTPHMTSASPGHVTYHDCFDPARLVLDVHSHGEGKAYFSHVDDQSDLSRVGPYIAGVIAPRSSYSATRVTWRAVCAPYLIGLDRQTTLVEGLFA